MSVQYKGTGDPRRSLELLWRAQREPTRGPKPGLSVDQIVSAAIQIADADGLAGVTMRRVADKLKVGTMTLYTYVPGKAELLDIMLDEVYAERTIVPSDLDGWRQRLEYHARQDWEMYQRHPWTLQVSEARSLLGPNEIALYESALAAVAGLGLDGREMIAVVSLVTSYVRGAAQVAVDAALVSEQTGITDEHWWEVRAPLLDEYFDQERYPTMSSIEFEAPFDSEDDGIEYHVRLAIDSFEFGLMRVLDGIAVLVDQRQS